MLTSDGTLKPRLATSWSRASTGGWTFSLDPTIRFQNGKRADARTIVTLLRNTLREPAELGIHPGFREIIDISETDSEKFLIRTRNGRLSLLDEIAEVNLGEGGEEFAAGAFRVGTIAEQGFSAYGFDRYYRGRPAIGRVDFTTFRSPRAAWAAMMRDEIDALYDVGREAVEFVERDPGIRVYPFLRPYLSTLLLNVNTRQFSDPHIRVALSQLVDRHAIVKVAYRGRGQVAEGPLWPAHWALRGVPAVTSYDPAAGIRALASAPKSHPGRLKFRCLVPAGAETQPFERMALMLQKQFVDAGVDMELELVSPTALVQKISSGAFEAALFELVGRTPSWLYGFWRSPAGPHAWIRHGYSGADRELDAMHLAETEAELKRSIAAVYRRMSEDPPAIFIAWPQAARAVSTRFEIPVEKGADIMGSNLHLWRPARQP